MKADVPVYDDGCALPNGGNGDAATARQDDVQGDLLAALRRA